jgi:hypothetical protein
LGGKAVLPNGRIETGTLQFQQPNVNRIFERRKAVRRPRPSVHEAVLGGSCYVILYVLRQAEEEVLSNHSVAGAPCHDHPIGGACNPQIGGPGKINHCTRMLIHHIKKYSGWQIDGPGMHQIAFEENFKPVAAFGHREDEVGSILDFRSILRLLVPAPCVNSAICQQGLGGSNRFSR